MSRTRSPCGRLKCEGVGAGLRQSTSTEPRASRRDTSDSSDPQLVASRLRKLGPEARTNISRFPEVRAAVEPANFWRPLFTHDIFVGLSSSALLRRPYYGRRNKQHRRPFFSIHRRSYRIVGHSSRLRPTNFVGQTYNGRRKNQTFSL